MLKWTLLIPQVFIYFYLWYLQKLLTVLYNHRNKIIVCLNIKQILFYSQDRFVLLQKHSFINNPYILLIELIVTYLI